MKKQQVQIHRKRLQALADRLQGALPGLRDAALRGSGGDASGNLSHAPLHLADLATDNFEQEVAVGLLQNEQQVLGAIATAMQRLDAGTYGHCEDCGEVIPDERLEALPYTMRCTACEQRLEEEGGLV